LKISFLGDRISTRGISIELTFVSHINHSKINLFRGCIMKNTLFLFIAGLLFMGLNVYAQDDVSIDSDGNVTTGVSNTYANFEVIGASAENAILGLTSGTGASGVVGVNSDSDFIGLLGTDNTGAYGGDFSSGNYGELGTEFYGVYGYSPSGYAGYFQGDARITGNLTVDGSLIGPVLGDITGVTAGTGLTGGGTSGDVTLNADTTVLQSRVNGSCSAGQSIRAISSTGTVTCEVDDVNDADADSANELQTLDRIGTTLILSNGGGSQSIADDDNDSKNELNTNLSLIGTTLQLTDAGSTLTSDLVSLKDNLGNHTATQNIVLGSHYLSGDGGNEGILVGGNGNISIGTDVYTTRQLSVLGGSSDSVAGYFETIDNLSDAYGLYGMADGAGGLYHFGVYGSASGATYNYGLRGITDDTAATANYGVYGSANNGTNNYGVYGYAPSGTDNYAGYFNGHVRATGNSAIGTTVDSYRQLNVLGGTTDTYAGRFETDDNAGSSYGLYGLADGAGGTIHNGVYGTASGATTNHGLRGFINDSSATTNYGVYGSANNGTNNYGVYGYASGGTTDYAGYFDGNLTTTGNVAIGTTVYSDRQLNVKGGVNTSYAGVFESIDNTTDAYGLYGGADGNGGGNHFGVAGYAVGADRNYGISGFASDGDSNYGVRGIADDTTATTNYGVYGKATGGDNNYSGYFWGGIVHVQGDIEYTGTITDISDGRLKENIQRIENALAKVERINGVYFNMKDTPEQTEVGVIAQDVKEVLPEAVSIVDREKGYLGVSYPSLIPVLIEAVKEQQATIRILSEKVRDLEKEIKLRDSMAMADIR
jgi:hypothetical protein